MKVRVETSSIVTYQCDLIAVNLFEGVKVPTGATKAVDKALGGYISKLIKNGEITGKKEEATLIDTQGKIPAKRVVVVGLGKKEELDLEGIRRVSASIIKTAKHVKAKKVASVVHGAGSGGVSPVEGAQALVEGALLAEYHFEGYAKVKEGDRFFRVEQFVILEIAPEKARQLKPGVEKGSIVSEAVNNARELVNAPANLVTPNYIARYSVAKAKEVGIHCKVLDAPQIKEKGMLSFYSVAKGSDEKEKMVILRWNGDKKSKEWLGLIGKGVTFDSGGISIKPSNKMWEMKTDMAGAAACLEAMIAIAKLKVKSNVLAVLPFAENMPDGRAQKPGDVIGSLSGKTIEIISTDAEGRMVLADAVTYAKQLGATKLVDVATLTGACTVALGDVASGIMGNDDYMIEAFKRAGEKTGERVWQLPLYEEYKEYSKSDVADIKNCTEMGKASASIGGLFVQLFVENTPWIHIDIAGTAYLDRERGYYLRGATGIPVRSLIEFISNV
ncbi:MAG: leucyl aminopeptidase [Candidatus Saganbacteria bacterium]|nr:leucyl aminopeptidase [Candidatus Saganbacteria bacterium]